MNNATVTREQKRNKFKIQEALHNQRRTIFREKLKESFVSVFPITIIVLLLCFTVAPVPADVLLSFLVGAVMLIIGMGFFTLGADLAMLPLGERVGVHITKTRKIWIILLIGFLIGMIITISEPDLQVLANQVSGISNMTLVLFVAVGVGIFMMVAFLRMIIGVKLSYIIITFYILLFALAAFVPTDFLAVAFDAGGVTTGPMTVPFIMALGVGVASVRNDKHAENDSFGMVAICSIGPIMAVLILTLIFKPDSSSYVPVIIPDTQDSVELLSLFTVEIPHYIKEMVVAMAPIAIFFLAFQLIAMKLKKQELVRMMVGIVYTYVGLVLFLTGVNVGFMPAGNYLGQVIAGLPYSWILIPISMVIGYFIVAAEPAVHVLNKQVEEITAGAIPQKAMNRALAIGVACSLGLAMLRVMFGIPIMVFLIPGYAIALVLTFFVPKIFTAIAFDSGGVASGPMTATFVLPFAMGACTTFGGNIVADAFGVIAMVAMTPLITIQVLGLYYKLKIKKSPETEKEIVHIPTEEDIIELL